MCKSSKFCIAENKDEKTSILYCSFKINLCPVVNIIRMTSIVLLRVTFIRKGNRLLRSSCAFPTWTSGFNYIKREIIYHPTQHYYFSVYQTFHCLSCEVHHFDRCSCIDIDSRDASHENEGMGVRERGCVGGGRRREGERME